MATLLVAEKPKVARRIADALGDYTVKKNRGVKNYVLNTQYGEVIVAPAVGHIFTLEQQEGDWTYPVFDVEWVPSHTTDDGEDYMKKYYHNLQDQGEKADTFINGCDFDIEGSTIGYTCITMACNGSDDRIQRMKFSTLTSSDLQDAFDNLDTFDQGQTEAGLTRHILDWYYGINISRALMLAVRSQNRYKTLSTGRVQGPALKIVAEKEREIQDFEPEDYWEIVVRGAGLEAQHEDERIWEEPKADAIMKKCSGKDGEIIDLSRNRYKHNPPIPFNLTGLQSEASSQFNIDPKRTQQIAQSLYEDSLISYPRTESQKLPAKIGYKNILNKLKNQDDYEDKAEKVLKKDETDDLYTRQGKKTDDAHPAIYPTGLAPKNLSKQERKVYDLIVKRFFAVFGDAAQRETLTVTLDVNGELFEAKGKRTVERNWFDLYEPYVNAETIDLPDVEEGQHIPIDEIEKLDKETQPPRRYTQSSLVNELEKKDLGTKCLTEDQQVLVTQDGARRAIPVSELFEIGQADQAVIEQDKGVQIMAKNTEAVISHGNGFQTSTFSGISRRPLADDESVYCITFRDGSTIKATGNHPMLVYDADECGYMPVEWLEPGMTAVRAHRGSTAETPLIEFDEFISLLDEDSSLYGDLDLIAFRNEHGLSQQDVADMVGTSQSAVFHVENRKHGLLRYWKHLSLPEPQYLSSENFDLKIRNPFPLHDSPALLRLVGMLQGDGSLDHSGKDSENAIDYRYHNTEKELLEQFQNDVEELFGYRPDIRSHGQRDGQQERFYVQIPAVIGRIIHIVTAGLSQDWIMDRDNTDHYIAALMADEGHVCTSEPKLFISNTDHMLLTTCQNILQEYGIDTTLAENQHKLHVRGRRNLELFLEHIPLFSTRKHQALIDLLERHYLYGNDQSTVFRERTVLTTLQDKAKTVAQLSDELGHDKHTIKYDIDTLRENGYVEKTIRGISEPPRKEIYYRATTPVHDTFYSEIGEQAVGSGHTTTIAAVEEIDYNGHVYDILNTEHGNFLTANNIVIHNSTRANIVESLYNRKYIDGKSIEVTDLGMAVVEALEDHCPDILSPELTREFEQEMEQIREQEATKDEVLQGARKALKEILQQFKEDQEQIGEELIDAVDETRKKERQLGPCDQCDDGTLRIIKKNGKFVGCSNYPDCENTYPLPGNGKIEGLDELCDTCNTPRIKVIRKGRKPYTMCIDPDCPTKDDW